MRESEQALNLKPYDRPPSVSLSQHDPVRYHTAVLITAQFIEECIRFSKSYEESQCSDSTTSTVSYLGSGSNAYYNPDPHAVSYLESVYYYKGLYSGPILLYRTGKKRWPPPRGPMPYSHSKELCEVFTHPITKLWNRDLAWKVVSIMDAHKIRFTTIDVVRFKLIDLDEVHWGKEDVEDEENVEGFVKAQKESVAGPVTIWIGVFPESTTPTAAHNAAQDVLALLRDYEITDVDIEYRESYYMREGGPQLLKPVDELDPLVEVVSPLTPALGLSISTTARPNAQGTMALYLAEGGNSNRLLGLSCRHVLIGSKEGNTDYVHRPGAPSRDVLLLSKGAFNHLIYLIKLGIGLNGLEVKILRDRIERLVEEEKGTDTVDIEEAKADRIETQRLVDEALNAMEALKVFLDRVNKDWKKLSHRIIGHILRSPAINLGVGEHRFTEDWGIFQIDRAKLGDGFKGNKLYLGTKLGRADFTLQCLPCRGADWKFEYPHDCFLPLSGTITDDLMLTPDMWNSDGEPCLLVVKRGNTTDTTIGRANGAFSIVRDYFTDMSVHQTSMEWAIINYDSKSEVFSEPGDSGSIIADIRGRIGGMLTGGSGRRESPDITYATPFWWLLERIKANGFPNVHLDVLA